MKWKILQHNGILFPPDFESKGIRIKIKGQEASLDLLQEEMITSGQKRRTRHMLRTKYFRRILFQTLQKHSMENTRI